MPRSKRVRWQSLLAAALLLLPVADLRGDGERAELRAMLAQQEQEIEALARQVAAREHEATPDDRKPRLVIADSAVQSIVADYLHENPGAGMPASVQTGYDPGGGFFRRSTSGPRYIAWNDECKIPFELRFRGTLVLDYTFYKVTDNINHATGQPVSVPSGDFSQNRVRMARISFEGTAFTPNLRYVIQLQTGTTGVGGPPSREAILNAQQLAADEGGDATLSSVRVGDAVRLHQAYVAYDIRPCCAEKGCGSDCPADQSLYAPTYTLIAGKLKALMGLERYLGVVNDDLDEASMADLYFGPTLGTAAGFQVKAAEDRLFVQALVTNGFESGISNDLLDNRPGLTAGLWYDLGGNWNAETRRWDLFGTTIPDLTFSCRPVVRIGGGLNFVPLGRRSVSGDAEPATVYVMPAAPGGTRFIQLIDGQSGNGVNIPVIDSFHVLVATAYVAGKYRGFNWDVETWARRLDHFHFIPGLNGTDPATLDNPLLGKSHLTDLGVAVQVGYFVVPSRLQLLARCSVLCGDSGDFNPNELVAAGAVGSGEVQRELREAFRHYHAAEEYSAGIAYYFKGASWKWLNDVACYQGGNPAASGRAATGYIPGVDGWLLRSRIQLSF